MTFFTPSLTFISGKNILSNLLIIILPCIVRILWQNIQKLATELHLAVLRNKKGGDAGSRHIAYRVHIAYWVQHFPQHHLSGSGIAQLESYHCREPACGTPPMTKVMRKEARHTQRRDRVSGVPLDILEHLPPKTRVCLLYCFVLSPLTLRGLSPTTISLSLIKS